MISEAEALAHILAAVPAPGAAASEKATLDAALHRRAAQTVQATVPLPGFDNSMMDGYAVRAAETASADPLQITGTQPAGHDLGLSLRGPRQAVRLYTGAPLPAGADAVIMQEDVRVENDAILCQEPVQPGENIRRRGSDLCAGQTLLQPGDLITPGRIGLLASQGITTVEVARPPRAAVLCTGDELVPPDAALQPGQLYNSNGPMLTALLRAHGIGQATYEHCADTLEATTATLDRLAQEHEVILISGGVSVGDRDFVKPALAALGLPPQLWRVRVKPGKPFLFTHRPAPRPLFVFGLPGNPVSAFITFQLFVRPALLRLSGAPESGLAPPTQTATLDQPLANPGDRPHYLRGRLAEGRFHVAGLQRSDALFALSQANALLRLDPGQSLPAGAEVSVIVL